MGPRKLTGLVSALLLVACGGSMPPSSPGPATASPAVAPGPSVVAATPPTPSASAALFVGASQAPVPDGPRASTQAFDVPFTYSVPAAADLRAADSDFIIRFDTDPSAAGASRPTGAGVLIASIATPIAHGCGGRTSIRSDPSGFLGDLVAVGHLTVGPARDATVVGRPARAADVGPRFGDCSVYSDVHLTGTVGSEVFYLTELGLLFALDLDGQPLAILAWADTEDRLAEFMPTADALLASIRFEER